MPRKSGRKGAGIINKLQYMSPGTNGGVRIAMAGGVIEISTTDEVEEYECEDTPPDTTRLRYQV